MMSIIWKKRIIIDFNAKFLGTGTEISLEMMTFLFKFWQRTADNLNF